MRVKCVFENITKLCLPPIIQDLNLLPLTIFYGRWGQTLTCVPLAAVEGLTAAAHLLARLVARLELLPGHVATEARLDFGSRLVGLWVIQGDVHDVLFLLRMAAFLLFIKTSKQ